MKILFVCLGNICRSPVLEAVLRAQLQRAGLDWQVASCGTGDWHLGQGADPRSCASALRRGYSLETHRARQLAAADYHEQDWLLAADRSNLAELQRLRPATATAQLALVLPYAGIAQPQEVPDPYYGGEAGFDTVIDLAEAFARKVIERSRRG
ncbi:MAG TPA: low molecular weight protein-tyrosine-phosphatase [Tahibacter sp.]|nr:low molecular weight protein-tyrosine-phosphatase [Tahibacter sp.]